jgi:hypothetical protein
MLLRPFACTPLLGLVTSPELLEDLPESFRCLVLDTTRLEPPAGSGVVTAPTNPSATGPLGPHDGLVLYAFEAGAARFTVGRSPAAAVVIRDGRISKEHAALGPLHTNGSIWLTDLGSSNGTAIGRHHLAPGEGGRALLAVGACFRLADVAIDLLDRTKLRALVAEIAAKAR